MQVTSLLTCSYFQPINKEYISTTNIFYRSVDSSLCCAFWCKHRNPKTNGSKLITWQTVQFFLEHPVDTKWAWGKCISNVLVCQLCWFFCLLVHENNSNIWQFACVFAACALENSQKLQHYCIQNLWRMIFCIITTAIIMTLYKELL